MAGFFMRGRMAGMKISKPKSTDYYFIAGFAAFGALCGVLAIALRGNLLSCIATAVCVSTATKAISMGRSFARK
jgi:hypothetical protein